MGEVANNDLATDITPVVEQMQESQNPQQSEPFIILPFDEEIPFQSEKDLRAWVSREQTLFGDLLNSNRLFMNGVGVRDNVKKLPQNLQVLIEHYDHCYDRLSQILDEMLLDKDSQFKAHGAEKERILRAWAVFISYGLVPMQSSFGECAMAMKNLSNNTQYRHNYSDDCIPQLNLVWLNALTLSRKHQYSQLSNLSGIRKDIARDSELLVSLEEAIKNGLDKMKYYEEKIETFRDKGLKAATLKSPADALGALEKGHKNTALGYLGVIALIVAVWINFVVFCYYPAYVKPLLDKAKDAPLEAGAMILTSMVFTGIVLTVVIILLRLAVSRINFSIAAGERKAMAAAYRALLGENAISDEQQLLFLQSIVGSKLPDFANSNDIRMPAEELTKLVKAVSSVKKDAF